jgi:hypothetical protein
MAAVAGLSEVGSGGRRVGAAPGPVPALYRLSIESCTPRDPDHVLGWKVLQNTPTELALGVDSPIGSRGVEFPRAIEPLRRRALKKNPSR